VPIAKNTIKLIDEIATAKGIEVRLEKVEQIQDIMSYGVMSTPGVVIDARSCTRVECRAAARLRHG